MRVLNVYSYLVPCLFILNTAENLFKQCIMGYHKLRPLKP